MYLVQRKKYSDEDNWQLGYNRPDAVNALYRMPISSKYVALQRKRDHTRTPTGNDSDVIFMTNIVFLRYSLKESMHSGMFTIEFESSSSLCSINFLYIEYGDPRVRKHVEENPNFSA